MLGIAVNLGHNPGEPTQKARERKTKNNMEIFRLFFFCFCPEVKLSAEVSFPNIYLNIAFYFMFGFFIPGAFGSPFKEEKQENFFSFQV